MNPALPLLILGHAPGTQAVEVVPRGAIERVETRWSVRFVPVPKGAPPLTFPDYSRELVTEVERLLERARTESSALAEAEAAQALAQAENLLRAHPELPQAAWLMAERHELAAALAERTSDSAHASLRQRAAALEPERAMVFGQAPSAVTLPPEVSVQIQGARAEDRFEWDGIEQAFPRSARSGEHQLRVLRGGELVWAGWVSVTAAAPVVVVNAPGALPCGQAALAATRNGPTGPIAPHGVTCPAWAVLRVERGRAEFSLCRGSVCGAWYADASGSLPARRAPVVQSSGLPRWATIALAGAGAALITSVTLWQTGAFDRDEPGKPRWVYQGYTPPEP